MLYRQAGELRGTEFKVQSSKFRVQKKTSPPSRWEGAELLALKESQIKLFRQPPLPAGGVLCHCRVY